MCSTLTGNPTWSENAQKHADTFIQNRVALGSPMTALELKDYVRHHVGANDPVVQENASKALRKWFNETGKTIGWTATDRTENNKTFLEYKKSQPVVNETPAPTVVTPSVPTPSEVVAPAVPATRKQGFFMRLFNKLFG